MEEEIYIYKKAMKKYGRKNQMMKTIEECSELIKAITKYLFFGGNIENVEEEVADVCIMILQLYYELDIEKIDNTIIKKTAQLRKMIEGDVND